jgi:hypothetical protein
MRRSLPGFAVIALLTAVPGASAAPTCVDRHGDTIRCATPGAMPVGWTPSPQILWERQLAAPQAPDTGEIVKVLLGIALFLAMIALMPEFDGSRAGGGWDRQEDDEEDGP